MNYDSVIDLEAGKAHVATLISENYTLTGLLPLNRTIEHLVDVTIETESRLTHLTSERQVMKAIKKRIDSSQFGIRSSNRQRQPPTPKAIGLNTTS